MSLRWFRREGKRLASPKTTIPLDGSAVPIGYVCLDQEARVLDVNPKWYEILGYSRDEVRGRRFEEFVAPASQKTFRARFTELLLKGELVNVELSMLRKNNRTVRILFNSAVERDSEGRIQRIHSFLHDISEVPSPQQTLERAEERFRELFNHMTSGVAVYEARSGGEDFVFVDFNRAAERADRISREEVLGKCVEIVFPGVKEFGLFEVLQRVWRTGTPEHFPVAQYRDERITGWRENHVYRLPSGEVVAVYEDVTERKRMEQALKESEKHFRLLYENAPLAYHSLDGEGRLLEVNPVWLALLGGYTRDEVVGRQLEGFLTPAAAELFRERFPQFRLDLAVHNAEFEMVRKDGTHVLVTIDGVAQIDAEGKYERCHCLLHDVTERKQAEAKLRESERSVQRKLHAILSPEGDIGVFELKDVLDAEGVQSMMDDFYATTHIGIAILDNAGEILVSTGWQDICTKFHRVHQETRRNCIESDTLLTEDVKQGKFRPYRCKNGMWDMATPLVIGDRRVGNLFLGQFFFDDEIPDVEAFRAQARRYGFDETQYLEALGHVPRWERQAVQSVMSFYTKLAALLSKSGYATLRNARSLAQAELLSASLQESRDQYQELIENLDDALFMLSPEGAITYVSPVAEFLTGYLVDELAGRSFRELVAPEDLPAVERNLVRALQGMPEPIEFRFLMKDGTRRWSRASGRPIVRCGRVVGITGIFSDISERRASADALAASEASLAQAQRIAQVGSWEYDIATGVTTWSDEMFRIFGRLPSLGVPDWEAQRALMPPEDWECTDRAVRSAIEQGTPFRQKHRIVHRDGRITWAQMIGQAHLDAQGKVASYSGTVQDITRDVENAAALRQSEEKFRTITENSADAIFIANKEGQYMYVNQAACDLLGYSSDELLGLSISDISAPTSRDIDRATFERLLEEGHLYSELELVRKDGSVVPADLNAVVLPNGLVYGSCRDFSERRHAEEALEASERWLREAQRVAHIGHWELDPAIGTPVWSDEIFRVFGLEPGQGEPSFTDHATHTHPDDWPLLEGAVARASRDGTAFDIKFRIVRPTGELRWMHALGTTIKDGAGAVLKLFGTAQDITDMERAREALVESEEKLRLVFAAINEGLTVTDLEGRVLQSNPAAVRMYGFNHTDEILGLNILDYVTEVERPRAVATLQATMETGGSGVVEFALVRSDGSTFPGEINGALIRDAAGKALGFVVTSRDVSERVETRQRLRESAKRLQALATRLEEVQEDERRRLSRELHDQVGQTLTALAMRIDGTLQALRDRRGSALSILEGSEELVDSCIQSIRNVMADLRPSVLDDYGLASALSSHAHWFHHQERLHVVAEIHPLEPRLPGATETALFRIAQEALTNVIKHANATQVRIRLTEASGRVTMAIADDGVGFPVVDGPDQGRHWGQLIMRERAEAVGGTLTVRSRPGEGTEVRVEVRRS